MTTVLVAGIVFVAACLQALSGFGFALITMPLVTLVIGLKPAAPLVALTALTTYAINVVRFRREISYVEVLPLAAASLVGIPLGLWALINVDEAIIRPILGGVLIAYAVYSLARPAAPPLRSARWALPAGLLAGCLGAAYNTPGPPLVVYGTLRQWPKERFRAILQAFFFMNGVLIVGSHAVAGHLTRSVLAGYAWSVPALALGLYLGNRLDKKLDQARFRTLLAAIVLVTGVSLLFSL